VEISIELKNKLKTALILEQEVYRVIEYCEKSGNKLFDPDTGCFTGHLQIGMITYWAEYKNTGDRFVLRNVYAHRMRILGEDRPHRSENPI
jgi:hypothetical protein